MANIARFGMGFANVFSLPLMFSGLRALAKELFFSLFSPSKMLNEGSANQELLYTDLGDILLSRRAVISSCILVQTGSEFVLPFQGCSKEDVCFSEISFSCSMHFKTSKQHPLGNPSIFVSSHSLVEKDTKNRGNQWKFVLQGEATLVLLATAVPDTDACPVGFG